MLKSWIRRHHWKWTVVVMVNHHLISKKKSWFVSLWCMLLWGYSTQVDEESPLICMYIHIISIDDVKLKGSISLGGNSDHICIAYLAYYNDVSGPSYKQERTLHNCRVFLFNFGSSPGWDDWIWRPLHAFLIAVLSAILLVGATHFTLKKWLSNCVASCGLPIANSEYPYRSM